jgi:hypothetical protein
MLNTLNEIDATRWLETVIQMERKRQKSTVLDQGMMEYYAVIMLNRGIAAVGNWISQLRWACCVGRSAAIQFAFPQDLRCA